MKGKLFGIVVVVALLGLIGYRIASYKKHSAGDKGPTEVVSLVRTAKLSRGNLAEQVSFTGTIRPRNEVDVFAKIGGRIETLTAQVGDKVKAGQVLATLEHKEIAWQSRSAQAALQVAQANLDGAKLDYDRTQKLFEGGSAPQAQLDGAKLKLDLALAQAAQAEAAAGLAEQQVANARVESPIAGTVIRRPVNLGAQVGPQSAMFTVQDVAALKLESSVDAVAFAKLAKGKEATVEVDALPGTEFKGKVSLLSPSLDAASRRAAARDRGRQRGRQAAPEHVREGDRRARPARERRPPPEGGRVRGRRRRDRVPHQGRQGPREPPEARRRPTAPSCRCSTASPRATRSRSPASRSSPTAPR